MKITRSGFTLVEIMFVVAIIGMLAALGIPAILDALKKSEKRIQSSNLSAIEKAKGMMQLPALVHQNGQSLTLATAYGDGQYTEENLMNCIQGASEIKELDVGKYRIDPGTIGEPATYLPLSDFEDLIASNE